MNAVLLARTYPAFSYVAFSYVTMLTTNRNEIYDLLTHKCGNGCPCPLYYALGIPALTLSPITLPLFVGIIIYDKIK
jgi:hypothetical protein